MRPQHPASGSAPRAPRHRSRAAALVMAMLAGIGAHGADTTPPDDAGSAPAPLELTLDELRTFTDVFRVLRRSYVDPVDDSALLEDALRGMVGGLDANSAYLSPNEYQRQEDSSRGRSAGIGADVRVDEGRLLVVAVSPAGPAADAGIAPGELIVAIDGRRVRGRPLGESLGDLAGAAGTRVRLRMEDPGGSQRVVTMERAYVPVPSVRSAMFDPAFAYLGLSHFHDGSADELRRALAELASRLDGAALRGIILDLRGNRGGVIGSAVDIADGFLDDGLIVRVRGRTASSRLDYRAEPGQWAPGVPLAVLLDRASASASEIVAGALQDHGRAVVLGERSFGKGTVQSVLPLRNGGALKLTTARYFTPSGESFADRGIEPDLPVADGAGDQEPQGAAAPSPETDAVLAAALDFLRG